MSEPLVFAWRDGTTFSFQRARERTGSSFGGPLDRDFSGVPHGPKPLHLIALLSLQDIASQSYRFGPDVPFVYGLCYSGCELKYRLAASKIEVLELTPRQSLDNWPYPNYPPHLPYIPLRLVRRQRQSYDQFADTFFNMPEKPASELVVAVPAAATIGMSLWGRYGDEDGVTIVFQCNLKDGIISATNVTS